MVKLDALLIEHLVISDGKGTSFFGNAINYGCFLLLCKSGAFMHETRRNLGLRIRRYGVPLSERSLTGFAPTTQRLGLKGIGYPFLLSATEITKNR